MILKKIKRLLFIAIIALLPIMMIGCDDEPVVETILPDSLEIYAVEGKDIRKLEVGEEFALAVEILPIEASQDVVWTSSNEAVASVSSDGVVKALSEGKVKISVASKQDAGIFDEYKYEITVYDYSTDRANCDEVISWLSEMYQDGYVVNDFLDLPTKYDSLPNVTITWNSSDPQILPITGVYYRQSTDKEITLTARIKSGQIQKEFSFKVLLESADKVELKSLKDKRLVFMYLYSGISEYTKMELQGIDVINLSFALIDKTTHKLILSDINRKYNSVIKAHSYGVRVVLSIGGWGADGFSQACSSADNRAIFIDSIMKAIKDYNFDGIDLDWEYPTSKSADIAATTADRVNFTLLCQELRAAMDAYKPGLLLTAAVSGSDTKYYEVKKLNEVFDYWHIMTYEYNSSAKSSYDSSYNQTVAGIKKWITAGATNTKIVLGVTFYGSVYKIKSLGTTDGVVGLGQTAYGGADHQSLKYMYPNIINNSSFTKKYDSINGMGYAYTTTTDSEGYYTFASFDTEESLKAKAQFIKQANLAGVMSWELCEDTNERTQLGKLLNALARYGK